MTNYSHFLSTKTYVVSPSDNCIDKISIGTIIDSNKLRIVVENDNIRWNHPFRTTIDLPPEFAIEIRDYINQYLGE